MAHKAFIKLIILLFVLAVFFIIPVLVKAYGGETLWCFDAGDCGYAGCNTKTTECRDDRPGCDAACVPILSGFCQTESECHGHPIEACVYTCRQENCCDGGGWNGQRRCGGCCDHGQPNCSAYTSDPNEHYYWHDENDVYQCNYRENYGSYYEFVEPCGTSGCVGNDWHDKGCSGGACYDNVSYNDSRCRKENCCDWPDWNGATRCGGCCGPAGNCVSQDLNDNNHYYWHNMNNVYRCNYNANQDSYYEFVEPCGTSSWSNNYCSGNLLKVDYTDKGCSGGSCYSYPTTYTIQNCDALDGYYDDYDWNEFGSWVYGHYYRDYFCAPANGGIPAQCKYNHWRFENCCDYWGWNNVRRCGGCCGPDINCVGYSPIDWYYWHDSSRVYECQFHSTDPSWPVSYYHFVAECGSGYWTNDYQCIGTMQQRKYVSQGCSGGGCYSNEIWYDWFSCPYCCSGGSCTGVCSPGATDVQSQACGNCGTQTRTRTCSGSCGWGSWGGWGTCIGEGACAVGATQSQACGNCGTQTRTCSGSCTWGGWGTCTGQGACTPGATQPCGDCGTQVCIVGCTWNPTCGCSTCNCNQYDTCVGTTYRDYSCSNGNCIFVDYPNDSRCNQTPSINLVAPSNDTWINTDVTFTGLVTDPNNDQVRAYFNIVSLYDTWGTLVNSGQNSVWTYSVPTQGCFTSWWRAYAEDEHGVTSGWTGYWLALVDKSTPTAAISYPIGTIEYATFTVSLTESDACSGIAAGDVDIRIKVPAPGWGNWQDYASTINDFNYTGTDGYQYIFRYRILDNAGNWSNFIEGNVLEININDPPTTTNLINTPSNVCNQPAQFFQFNWTYTDPEADTQSQFDFQIDNSCTTVNCNNGTCPFLSPEVNRTQTSLNYPSPNINSQAVTLATSPTSPGCDYLTYNTAYCWRAKTYDQHGLASSWIYGTPFTTSVHHYPMCDFTWIPIRPNTNETIQFTDTSKCWDEDPVNGADCSTTTGDTYSWTFGASATPISSTAENPLTKFSSSGNYNVTLQVTDSDGYVCSTTQTVYVNYPLPKWKEIRPW